MLRSSTWSRRLSSISCALVAPRRHSSGTAALPRAADAAHETLDSLREQVKALTAERDAALARANGRLAGKVSIVTGGGGGLGQAQCVRLAEEGSVVHIWETDAAKGAETLAKLGGTMAGKHALHSVDVADEDAVAEAVAAVEAQSGPIHVLVNNAAVFVFESVEDATEAQWDFSHSVLIKGTAFACKHVIPSMRRAGGGSIINFGSICGQRANFNFAVYELRRRTLLSAEHFCIGVLYCFEC
eukprot:COSAG03_NODE_1364_length_4251_cov_4.775771_2_plen_243_part_00